MKLKMAENSLFAKLLRSPWWISVAIAAGLSLLMAALLPADFKVVGALSSAPFLVIAAIAANRQRRLPSPARVEQTVRAIAAMNWPDFSRLLQAGFERAGFTVQPDKGSPVDFRLERQGRITLVSARRWKSARTGLEALRALQAALDAGGASDAIQIGLGELTETALPFARQHGIVVWQAAEIALLLRGMPLAPPPRG